MSYSWYRKGTCTVTNGSNEVRFQNANITTSQVKPVVGDAFTIDGSNLYEATFIGSDTGGEFIRLDRPFEQPTAQNTKYALVRLASSTINAKIAAIAAAAINQKQISLDDMYEWYTSTADTLDFTGPDGVAVTVSTYHFLSNSISTVGGNIADVEAVAQNIADVKTVSSNIAEVAAVGADMQSVSAVNADMQEVKAVAADIADVKTVGSSITEVSAVGSNIPAIKTVNTNINEIKAVNNNMPAINNVNAKAAHIDQQVTHVDDQVIKVDQQTAVATAKASESSASAAESLDSKTKAKASEVAAKLSETNSKDSESKAKLSETNSKASENAAKLSETNSKNSELATAADRVQTGKDVVSSQASVDKAKDWAEKTSGPVEGAEQSAKYWANIAKMNADLTFLSGGVFKPTSSIEYPTPDNPTRDTLFIIGFPSASDSYTFTSGDLSGVTVFNTDQLLWDVPLNVFKHIPSPTGAAILSVNNKTGSSVEIKSEDVPHEGSNVSAALKSKVNKSDKATTTTEGVTQLSNKYDGALETKAVTEKALSDGLTDNKTKSDQALSTGLNTKSDKGHKHNADDIDSGTLAAERLPDASTSAKGATTLSNSIKGTSESKAVTEKALTDATAEASKVAFVYIDGDLTKITETLPRGERVTDFTYVGGNLTQAAESYGGITATTTYTYNSEGTLTGVTRV